VRLFRQPQLDPDPILYHFLSQPTGWDAVGEPGYLFVQGPLYDVFRPDTVDESRAFLALGVASFVSNVESYAERVQRQRQAQNRDPAAFIAQIQSESKGSVGAARLHVSQVRDFNARIALVLRTVHRRNVGNDDEAWKKWWSEDQGYAYEPSPPQPRLDLTHLQPKTTYAANIHYSCFAGGTPVHTDAGLRPIESIHIGDQILTADPRTGGLHYRPVVVAVRNQPAELLNIKLPNEEVRATGIHRFWKAGQGWVMSRDLRPGDRLRAVDGVVEIVRVDRDRTEPVYNLQLMETHSFFVGERGVLVHDNSVVQAVVPPFDAVPELAAET
jgi:hypothetical protein